MLNCITFECQQFRTLLVQAGDQLLDLGLGFMHLIIQVRLEFLLDAFHLLLELEQETIIYALNVSRIHT